MPELVAVIVFVAVLFAIEVWYVRHNQTTISEHAQALTRRMDKQLVAGIAFLLGALAGWFVAHFTS